MEGNQLNQPLDKFHAPGRVIHHCGTKQGLWIPPLVQKMWYVHKPGGGVCGVPRYHNVLDGSRAQAPPSSRHHQVCSSSDGFGAQYLVLENVYTFNYLVKIISIYDSNWPMVDQNLQRAWRKWGRFSHLVCQEGDDTRKSGIFYAVVQSVLIFGSESWVVAPCILWDMRSIHNWVMQWISG